MSSGRRTSPSGLAACLAFAVAVNASAQNLPPTDAGRVGSLPRSEDIYQPVTPETLERIQEMWASRDLGARSVEVVYAESQAESRILLVRHEVSGKAHYGAILLPDSDDLSGTPVMLIADGLNQEYPAIDIEKIIAGWQGNGPTPDFIRVVPGFRGRTLKYAGMEYLSEGDFCDAFDGAADDAIAMLNVAQTLLPAANFDDVLAWGASRGGNVALLMGIRDERVNTVMASAAPVDFYWPPLREELRDQFACQFLEGKSAVQARERMVASSPLYFDMQDNVEDVFLYHGTRDDVVPMWNSYEMARQLEASGVSVTSFFYRFANHGNFIYAPAYSADYETGIEAFRDNLAN